MVPGPSCLVCRTELTPPSLSIDGDWEPFDCPNCGRYRLSGSVLAERPPSWERSERSRAVVSHAIRKMQRSGSWPLLGTYLLQQILTADDLPLPSEQVDLLLDLVGTREGSPGAQATIQITDDRAVIGAESANGVMWAIGALVATGLATLDPVMGPQQHISLTLEGWRRLQELRGGRLRSRRAFMAMQYGDDELEPLYAGTLRPAVAKTGFELVRLDEPPPPQD